MEVYNGVDPKVIDRAVLYIVLCVIIVVFTMVGYFEDFAGGDLNAGDIGGLVFDMVIDFAMLFLIYSVINRNNGARVAAAILAILNLVFYIAYTFRGISHVIVTVCTILCLILLLTNPIRRWCLPQIIEGTLIERIKSKENRLNIAGTFCLLYAIVLLIIAAMLLFYNSTFTAKITFSDLWKDIAQMLISAGYASSMADAENLLNGLFLSVGTISLIGGIMMILPAHSCFEKKAYIPGLVVLILVTIASIVSIIGFVIGILVVLLYLSCKSEFEKNVPDTDDDY